MRLRRALPLVIVLVSTACSPRPPSTTRSSPDDGCAPPDPATLMSCRSYGDPVPVVPRHPTDDDVARLLEGDDCYEVTTLAEHADAVAPALARIVTSSPKKHLRDRAMLTLGALRCRQHRGVIEDAAASGDPVTRVHAAKALEEMR